MHGSGRTCYAPAWQWSGVVRAARPVRGGAVRRARIRPGQVVCGAAGRGAIWWASLRFGMVRATKVAGRVVAGRGEVMRDRHWQAMTR